MEIYGLYDPDSGELRYVGKAKSSAKRLKTHIWDSRTAKRPVCLWIAGLVAAGKAPVMRLLETVDDSEWKAAEKRLIALHRKTSSLLNLAHGGDEPFQTKEQRAANARAMNKKMAEADPRWRAYVLAKREMARVYARLKKKPDYTTYWMRLIMKCHAAQRPDLCGEWASL